MPNRIAREFLMLGEKMTAQRAQAYGMVNHVVPREELFEFALAMAEKLASRPRFALALTKQAFNLVDDIQGKRTAMEGGLRPPPLGARAQSDRFRRWRPGPDRRIDES